MKYSSLMVRPAGVWALTSYVPASSTAPENALARPRSRRRSNVVVTKVAPADMPPMASLVVPNRSAATSSSHKATASQSSGAAGQGNSGASR